MTTPHSSKYDLGRLSESDESYLHDEEAFVPQIMADEKGGVAAALRRRPVVMVGAAVVLVAAVFILGALFLTGGEAPTVSDPSATAVEFKVGPIHVRAGKFNMSEYYVDSPVPEGAAIVHVSHELQDEFGNHVPLEHAYNHHVFLGFMDAPEDWDSLRLIVGFGAEGVGTPLDLPHGYGIVIPANKTWIAAAHVIDLIGRAATYNQTVYMRFTVRYVDGERARKASHVSCGIAGIMAPDGDVEFPVPGGGGEGSDYAISQTLMWPFPDATIVYSSGHIHIGGKYVTLTELEERDGKTSETPLLHSEPHADEFGFVVRTDIEHPMTQLRQSHKYNMTAVYDNSRHMGEVMALFQICLSFPADVEPFAWQYEDINIRQVNTEGQVPGQGEGHSLRRDALPRNRAADLYTKVMRKQL